MFFLLKFNYYQKKGGYLIFSLPQSNQYQQIKDFKILFPEKYHIIKENRWGNKVIVFRLNDVLQKYPKISFNLQPKEIKLKINKAFALNHYPLKQKPINNSFINAEDKKIKTLAKKIIGEEKNLSQIIKKLYDFTLGYLNYGKPIEGLYSYKQALTEKTTDCGGFSTFLASLLQSQNIPCRLVVGFIIKDNFLKRILNTFHVLRYTFHDLFIHVWLEALLPDNSWLPLDPSIEWKRKKGLSKRQGGFGYIPADRLVVSFDCDFDIKIGEKNYKIDLLQKPKVI